MPNVTPNSVIIITPPPPKHTITIEYRDDMSVDDLMSLIKQRLADQTDE